MRQLSFLFFNLIALYFLYVFMFGKGGALDNLNKLEKIHQLEIKRLRAEVELEELKSQWYRERDLQEPDLHFLADNGRKLPNTVIFKFEHEGKRDDFEQRMTQKPHYRFYFMVAVAIFLFGLFISDFILIYHFGNSV